MTSHSEPSDSATTHSFTEGKALSSDIRGTTPEQIAAIIERLEHIKNNSKDWVAPSGCLTARVMPGSGEVKIEMRHPSGDAALFSINQTAHTQLADKLGIPGKYAERCRHEAPGLLANNFNYWFANDPDNYTLRTLDGRLRAVLSRRYRILDSHDFFFNAYDEGKAQGAVVQRLDLSETNFYMRMLSPDYAFKIYERGKAITAAGKGMFSSGYKGDNGQWGVMDNDDPDGDWCFATGVFSNSDVGRGGMNMEFGAMRTTCSNLILVGTTFHKIHLGEEQGLIRLSAETRKAKDEALWLEVRDAVRSTFNPDEFKAILKRFNESQEQELAEPVEAVDTIVAHYGLSEAQKTAIMNEFVSPSTSVKPGATLWGLSNAVSMLQHGVEAVDDMYAFARMGGEIIMKGEESLKLKIR